MSLGQFFHAHCFPLSKIHHLSKSGLVLFLFVMAAATTNAQIINIEDKRKNGKEDGISGQVDFNFKYTKNTQRIWELGNRSGFQYQKNRSQWLVFSDFRLIRSGESDLINKGYGHLRYNYQLKDTSHFSVESWLQVQYNEVQKIDRRALLGAGARFKYLKGRKFEFHLGMGAMYEQEKGNFEESQIIRNSNYIFLKWVISDKMRLNSISYFQPRIDLLSDYRYANESALTYEIGEHLSVFLRYELLYDSEPSEGVPSIISELSNGVRFKF